MKTEKFDISVLTILKIALVGLGLYLAWLVRDIIFLVLIILIVVSALVPIVDRLESKKVPRIISVLIIYLLFIGLLVGLGFLIIPPLITQIQLLAQNLPNLLEKFSSAYGWLSRHFATQPQWVIILQNNLQNLAGQLSNITGNVIGVTINFFAGIVSFVTMIVLTFYLLLEKNSLKEFFSSYLPAEIKEKFLTVAARVSAKWGAWFRGQLILSLVIGIIVWIGLIIIGVPYALTLAVIAAFTELIPIIGPVLGAIPAIIVAFTVSPWKALIVLIFYVIAQQLEGHILVPKVMQRQVGLSPVIIVVAILVGGKLFGLLGVLLAVPLTAGFFSIAEEYKKVKEEKQA